MCEVVWKNDLVIRLINEYRKKPMLWDVNHNLYRSQTAKYEAYSDLAAMFGCDVVDLRKKLNSIFASHRREKIKIRGGGRSYWFLYQYLSFLPSHLEMPEMKKTDDKVSESSYEEENISEEVFDDSYMPGLYKEVIVKDELDPVVSSKPKRVRPVHHKTRIVKKPVNRQLTTSQLDSRLIEAVKLLRRSELSKKKDQCDSFGEYIAVSLRKHDDRTQAMIKQAINNILFEQEMKKHNTPQYVVISGMDENPLTLSDTDCPEK